MTTDASGRSRAEPAFRQLCHMLSLSKTRKVQSAIDNLVLTTLSLDPKVGQGGDPNELALAISTYFGVTIDVGDVRLAIENHLKAGRLLIDRTSSPSAIALSVEVRAQLSERIDASERLEREVREEWLALSATSQAGLPSEKLWGALQSYLGQVFNQHGAEAVQLLDSRSGTNEQRGTLPRLLDQAIDSCGLSASRAEARSAIRAFFTAPSAKRLRYMSELLDGTFTFFALTVSDSTAEYLKGQVPSLKLFLDTNVVLAVLGLQNNSMQEADVELLDIIKSEKYPFKLYYHERTLKEILEILDAARSSLRRRHFTPALSRAYLQYTDTRGGGFGLERQFHEMNAKREIDTEAFLARFNHVEDLLRDRGIQRYNQAGPDLDTTSKGEYIAEFEHFLAGRRRQGKPQRRYEALDHDVTVWMYLQRQRNSNTNALRSGALLLSNDYSLHGFDRSFLMSSASGRMSPTVVLPHHLLQILRPFSRVTNDFDRRFMEIFAAPEFRTTQTDYGETASRVLSYLASFDGVPTETAVHILNDDLLMGRLKDVEATEAEFAELIENAVIAENSALVESLSEVSEHLTEAKRAASTASEVAESERAAREESERRVQEVRAAAEAEARRVVQELEAARVEQEAEAARRREADQRADQEAEERAGLQAELLSERARRETAENSARRSERRWRAVRWLLTTLVTGGLITLVVGGPAWFKWQSFLNHQNHVAMQALAVAVLLGAGYLAGGATKHRGLVVAAIVVGGLITLLSLL